MLSTVAVMRSTGRGAAAATAMYRQRRSLLLPRPPVRPGRTSTGGGPGARIVSLLLPALTGYGASSPGDQYTGKSII